MKAMTLALLGISLHFAVPACYSQETSTAASSPAEDATGSDLGLEPGFLEAQITGLSSENFRTRQVALERLQRYPTESLALIDEVIYTADHNVGAELVDLLGILATHSDLTISGNSRRLLRNVSKQPTYAGSLAANTVRAIADLQESQAIQRLVLAGAKIHNNTIQLHALRRPIDIVNPRVLQLAADFDNQPQTVAWIPFLKTVEMIVLDNVEIDSQLMSAISALKQLRVVKLRHVTLQAEDLWLLKSLDSLEYLEIAYTKIDDSAIGALAALPVSQNIRLYGTEITPAGASRLQEQLDSVEIFRGNGGFLGVGTNPSSTLVTRVVRRSSADLAGIRIGDQLTRINSVEIKDFEDLRGELGKSSVGNQIKVELLRRDDLTGKQITRVVDVTLGEEPLDQP